MATIQEPGDRSEASLVRSAIARWRGGETPDAEAVLNEHPQLRNRKSLAIDLIYEEFCLRKDKGETFVASTFCNRFPAYKQSLARMLDVHEFMAASAHAGPSWPEIGDVLLGFEIVEPLGAGAVAKVYLAREREVGGRLVVVKVSQFGRGEARLLGKLNHPGVVPIHSVAEDPLSGMTCICMPFLGTATLVDLLDAAFKAGHPPPTAELVGRVALGYLPQGIDPGAWGKTDPFFDRASYEEAILHLCRQIVAALAKAHQSGILHRDIKPSNVLLSRDARPMLLDFNLSTDEQLPAERMGGTLAYMPPERIEGLAAGSSEAESADTSSDLYSVGAMMYELLTGHLPTRPKTGDAPGSPQPALVEWLQCRRGEAPPARRLNPRVEPQLDAILARCLAPQPARRFASAEELHAALIELLRPRVRLVRQVRRERRTILASGLSLAAGAALGLAYAGMLPPLSDRLYDAGIAAYNRAQMVQAQDLFTRAIEAGSDSRQVYFARAQAHRQLQANDAFKEDIAQVIKKEHEDGVRDGIGLLYLGYAMFDTEGYRESHSLFEQCQQRGWDTVEVANYRGLSQCRLGFNEQGLPHFDRILAAHPELDRIRFNRTLACALLSSLALDERALADAEHLAAKYPDNVDIMAAAAMLFSKAAKQQPQHRERARALLLAAEAAGLSRSHSQPWWDDVESVPPPLPSGSPAATGPLQLDWQRRPACSHPSYDECIRQHQLDKQLPPLKRQTPTIT